MSEMTFEQFREKLIRWSAVLPKEMKKALTEAAHTVQREAQEKHLSGPRMPRGVGDETNATLSSSEPRHSFRLRRSIAIDVVVKPGEVSATIGTNMPYARIHEYGGMMSAPGAGFRVMPARPFLRPSLAAKHHEIFEKLRVRMFESYNQEGVTGILRGGLE